MPDEKPSPSPMQPGTAAEHGPTNARVVYVQNPLHIYDRPVYTYCHFCRQMVLTYVMYRPGMATWLAALGFCLIGCWLCCFLIPFAVQAFNDAQHYCPLCRSHLGTCNRI